LTASATDSAPHHTDDNRSLHPFPTRRSSDLDGVDRDVPPPHLTRQRPGHPHEAGLRRGVGGLSGVPPETSYRSDVHDATPPGLRSEEHTSELQSRENLVCRLLLEKKEQRGRL